MKDSPVGDVIMTDVDPEYEHCFLKANSKRGFTNEDTGDAAGRLEDWI